MPDGLPDFALLLERARSGDREALAQLTRQYEPKVRVVARVLLGPALRPYLDSMDLVQSVHHSLMAGLRQRKFEVATPDQLIALTVTLVRRKVARHWRHLQRQKRLVQDGNGSDLPGLLASLSSPGNDPAREAQLNDALQHLCRNLNETERRLLDLRLQGYTTSEIAARLGLHPIALRVRMTRLRQRLQENGVLTEWL